MAFPPHDSELFVRHQPIPMCEVRYCSPSNAESPEGPALPTMWSASFAQVGLVQIMGCCFPAAPLFSHFISVKILISEKYIVERRCLKNERKIHSLNSSEIEIHSPVSLSRRRQIHCRRYRSARHATVLRVKAGDNPKIMSQSRIRGQKEVFCCNFHQSMIVSNQPASLCPRLRPSTAAMLCRSLAPGRFLPTGRSAEPKKTR